MGWRMRSLILLPLVLLLAVPIWALGGSSEALAGPPAPGVLYPMLPTQLTSPSYDYAAAETCAGCHYISAAEGILPALDHTSRAVGVWLQPAAAVNASCTTANNPPTQFGVPYTCCTGKGTGTCGDMWQLTGSGWFASRHSQSDYSSTENGFCTKCHAPLQAQASASFNSTGAVINAGPVPQGRFQAVTCGSCHPPDNIVAQIGAMNPGALDGGAEAIYLFKGVNNPASYQTLGTGKNPDGTSQVDLLCLNCHEQRHNTENSNNFMYIMMYGHGIKCISCHMSSPQKIGGGSTGLPSLSEHFHDWNVGADLPYSCSCHEHIDTPGWTTAVMESVIPIMKEQHEDWWDLPPFNGEVQVAVSAHALPSIAEFKVLEREMSKIEAM